MDMARASETVYKEVAKRCSAYMKNENESMSNSCDCTTPSCRNCKHFTKSEYCDLDLYDKIVDEIK